MENTQALVMNTVTGRVDRVPRKLLDHAVFGKNLVEVEEGTKPYAKELHKTLPVEEFSERHPDTIVAGEDTYDTWGAADEMTTITEESN